VGLNVPVFGSYSSAEARYGPGWTQFAGPPPAIRMRPSASRVAGCRPRAVASEPVGLNVPVVGSNRLAEARGRSPASKPAATRTRPSASRVAVWICRPTPNEPVRVGGMYGLGLGPRVGVGLGVGAGALGVVFTPDVGPGPPSAGWPGRMT